MKKILLSFIIAMIWIGSVCAEMVTVTGHAPIINNNVAEARNKAVKDALHQALMQTGASVSYEQEVSNGALTRDNFKIKSSSRIKSYNIISQEQKPDYITVTVKADIISGSGTCSSAHSKSITPVKFFYDDGQLGESQRGLYKINNEITNQFYSRMLQNDKIFDTKRWIDSNFKLDLRSINGNELNRNSRQQLIHLARRLDTQYIMIGSIRDISFVGDDNVFTSIFGDPDRNISFSVFLINGYSGDVIFAKNYQGIAKWDVKEGTDVKSSSFWKSSYGKAINQMISNATADITREIQCQKVNARIIRIDRNEYYINAGENNKIKVGDHFSVALNNNFNDVNGQHRIASTRLKNDFVVSRVFDNTAILKSAKGVADTNIQIGDLATSHN